MNHEWNVLERFIYCYIPGNRKAAIFSNVKWFDSMRKRPVLKWQKREPNSQRIVQNMYQILKMSVIIV